VHHLYFGIASWSNLKRGDSVLGTQLVRCPLPNPPERGRKTAGTDSPFIFFTSSVEPSPSRPQKFQKADPSISTSLLHTQQYQVLLNGLFRKIIEPARSVFRKRTNRMFCIIIVPWAIVVVQKSKQRVSILFKSLPPFLCKLGIAAYVNDVFVE
jgi:hypothetical protein